jgi:phenylacetate-CoA ligase
MRREIESAWDMKAYNIYGLSEIIGPGVACECVETKDGLHIYEDHFYPEIIDPETGATLEDGERGELVFTSLTKEAFPIIRYRTRDLTRLLPGTARSFRRMEKVTGRTDDMMIIRGVNVFPTQIEEQLLKVEGLAPHFQIVLTRDGRMDVMTIRTEALPEAADEAARGAMADRLEKLVKDNVGISTEVIVGEPGAVPRSQGKAVRIVDERPKEG